MNDQQIATYAAALEFRDMARKELQGNLATYDRTSAQLIEEWFMKSWMLLWQFVPAEIVEEYVKRKECEFEDYDTKTIS